MGNFLTIANFSRQSSCCLELFDTLSHNMRVLAWGDFLTFATFLRQHTQNVYINIGNLPCNFQVSPTAYLIPRTLGKYSHKANASAQELSLHVPVLPNSVPETCASAWGNFLAIANYPRQHT